METIEACKGDGGGGVAKVNQDPQSTGSKRLQANLLVIHINKYIVRLGQ